MMLTLGSNAADGSAHHVPLDHARCNAAGQDGQGLAICIQHDCNVADVVLMRWRLPESQACIVDKDVNLRQRE